MLVAPAADICPVVHRVLVLVSFVCCALICVSFAMFASDQLAGASSQQQNALIAGSARVSPRGTHHGQPRRFIDGAARILTSPFRSLVQTDSQWAVHGLATMLALAAYGLGLGYLARFSRGLS
jgi:hypothetical protein